MRRETPRWRFEKLMIRTCFCGLSWPPCPSLYSSLEIRTGFSERAGGCSGNPVTSQPPNKWEMPLPHLKSIYGTLLRQRRELGVDSGLDFDRTLRSRMNRGKSCLENQTRRCKGMLHCGVPKPRGKGGLLLGGMWGPTKETWPERVVLSYPRGLPGRGK